MPKKEYNVTIEKDPANSSQVIIQGFLHIVNCDNPPQAIIAGSSIQMLEQEICSSSFPYTVEGSGKLQNNTINFNYYKKDEADSLNCSAVFTRIK